MATDASREDIEAVARADEKVVAAVENAGGNIVKVIVVPGKMVNLVVKK